MSKERRKHLRWKQDEAVYAYIDGDRTNLRSADLSGGGMFLVTDESIPLGVQIALVFRTQYKVEGQPIFLLAKVVRCQLEPIAGVGLRWEQAHTEAGSEPLVDFLSARLRLISPTVEVKLLDQESGRSRAWYQFTSATRSVPPPKSRNAGRGSSSSAPRGAKPPATEPSTSKEHLADGGTPLNIDASLVILGKTEPVRVYSLGVDAMSIAAEFMCPGEGTAVKVLLSFEEKWGATDVTCDCTVVRSRLVEGKFVARLDLRILEVDEGWQQGIFEELVDSFN